MRCNSVPAGETPTPITPEQQKDCAHLGHAESAGRWTIRGSKSFATGPSVATWTSREAAPGRPAQDTGPTMAAPRGSRFRTAPRDRSRPRYVVFGPRESRVEGTAAA